MSHQTLTLTVEQFDRLNQLAQRAVRPDERYAYERNLYYIAKYNPESPLGGELAILRRERAAVRAAYVERRERSKEITAQRMRWWYASVPTIARAMHLNTGQFDHALIDKDFSAYWVTVSPKGAKKIDGQWWIIAEVIGGGRSLLLDPRKLTSEHPTPGGVGGITSSEMPRELHSMSPSRAYLL